jgi:hypothetical protein
MTASALVKQSDLKRMAQIAKREGVRVEIEVNGKIIRVSPDIQDIHKPKPVDLKPKDFTSLSEWQAWRDQERAREAQRHS